jgi:hypothetical protein
MVENEEIVENISLVLVVWKERNNHSKYMLHYDNA